MPDRHARGPRAEQKPAPMNEHTHERNPSAIRYRLLAVDLDGTLLDSRSRVPPENRAALHRAHEAGMLVCLTTGRCYKEMRRVIDDIGLDLDVAVTVFGAIVSEARSGRTLHAQPIPQAALDRCCRFLEQRGFSFVLLHDGSAGGPDYSVIRRRRWSPGYDRWMEMVPCQFREVGHWNDITEPTCRVTFIETLEGLRELQPAVSSELPPSLLKSNPIYVHPYDIHALEFFAPQVNKWSALQYLCRRQGIGPDQVVAIGDSVNDLEMIQHAGLSFAVANADDTIRRLANYTAPANDEAGVAWAVNRVLSPPAE